MGKVRWGVLSTASIGRLVIEATRRAEHAEFVAVASRDAARARAFADELGLEASFGSYEELLASGDVDADQGRTLGREASADRRPDDLFPVGRDEPQPRVELSSLAVHVMVAPLLV